MSPYGSITTIHRAVVSVPDDVFEKFGHTKEYERFSLAASAGMEDSGQNSYADVTEWAEDSNRAACMNFINMWHNRILQWKEQL